VPKPVQPHCYGRVDLIQQRGVAMPERMKSALLNAEASQERVKLPLAAAALFCTVSHPVPVQNRTIMPHLRTCPLSH